MKEFDEFPKIARLSRMMTITEKIDGTNAQIFIGDDGEVLVGSRTRWITPEDDNFGFARWAQEHKDELLQLGPGRHFGEWWGSGIQRKYGQADKVWSLFNTAKWLEDFDNARPLCPSCCRVVPVLYRGDFDTGIIRECMSVMQEQGSRAAPGFMKPEGVVIYHEAARIMFKKTFEKDEGGKGANG
jgi:RNA ligase.